MTEAMLQYKVSQFTDFLHNALKYDKARFKAAPEGSIFRIKIVYMAICKNI